MQNEDLTTEQEQPIEQTTVSEETTTEETTTTQETTVQEDTQQIELLQSMNDTLHWNVAFQLVLVCLLLFNLFFTGLKAGKN